MVWNLVKGPLKKRKATSTVVVSDGMNPSRVRANSSISLVPEQEVASTVDATSCRWFRRDRAGVFCPIRVRAPFKHHMMRRPDGEQRLTWPRPSA